MTREDYNRAKDFVFEQERVDLQLDIVREMIERSEHTEWNVHHISIEGHKINALGIPDTLELPILYMIKGELIRTKTEIEEKIKNI